MFGLRKLGGYSSRAIAVVHAQNSGLLKELHQVPDEMDQSVGGHCNKHDKILHAVIVPLAAQGHVAPALQLARKLVTLDFHITFVNTTNIHDRMMKSQDLAMQSDSAIQFVSIPDGLPDDHPRLNDVPAFLDAMLKMGPALEELFTHLHQQSPITCVIRDITNPIVGEAAIKCGIPVVGFVTPSAVSLYFLCNIPALRAAGVLPLPPPNDPANPYVDPNSAFFRPAQSEEEAAVLQRLLTCLPGASPAMRVGDIPTMLLSDNFETHVIKFIQTWQTPCIPKCTCILFNTFQDLEARVIDEMRGSMHSAIYPIGPLVFTNRNFSANHHNIEEEGEEEPCAVGAGGVFWEEDHKSLSWLDTKSSKSVLYVSFGSMAKVSIQQVQELADGLEVSHHAFLWVIRSDLLENDLNGTTSEFRTMFSEFLERTQDRALVVPWVPQTAVLAHPAVGAFLTHCGWNSTIESISCGIPMLCWPKLAEQNTNCRYITHVWKVGLELEHDGKRYSGLVLKEEVENKVRRIMSIGRGGDDDPEIDMIRNNCRALRNACRKAVVTGGSSHTALLDFVRQMKQLAHAETDI